MKLLGLIRTVSLVPLIFSDAAAAQGEQGAAPSDSLITIDLRGMSKQSSIVKQFDWRDIPLSGPDWTTDFKEVRTTVKQQPSRGVTTEFAFKYASRITDPKRPGVFLNLQLLSKSGAVLDTFSYAFERDCHDQPVAVSRSVDHYARPYRVLEIDSAKLSVSHNTNVEWCKRGRKKQIVQPPAAFDFLYQKAYSFDLRVYSPQGLKFAWPKAGDPDAGAVYFTRNASNGDILDIYFAESGATSKKLLQSVGLNEEVRVGLSWELAHPCVEPSPAATTTLKQVSNSYHLRGFFVAPASSPDGLTFAPVSVYPAQAIQYNNVSSVAVWDPPAASPNRLVFYEICLKEPTLGYNTMMAVFASPPSIAQPFSSVWQWVPAK